MKRLLVITVIILIVFVVAGASADKHPRNKRNPFTPLDRTANSYIKESTTQGRSLKPPGVTDLYLNGIIWNEIRPIAIISDNVVMVGEKIAGRKICKITSKYVELENNGKKEVLTIIPKILFNITTKTSDK